MDPNFIHMDWDWGTPKTMECPSSSCLPPSAAHEVLGNHNLHTGLSTFEGFRWERGES